MTEGLVALTGLQAGIETTRGTAVPATRIAPLTATMKHVIERYYPQEDRNSFEDYFRSAQTKEHVEIGGATAWATFEDMPFWLSLFAKGGVTPSGYDGAYLWDFTPTSDADDLDTATFECFNDTTSWQIPFVVGNKIEIGWQRGQPVSLNMDFLGQTANVQAKTGSLTQTSGEDITDGLSACYIDTTTIGTTLAANVLSAKATIANGWEPIYTLSGTKYPNRFSRGNRRHAEIELVAQFDSTTEYDAFVAGTTRKVEIRSSGSGSNSFAFQLYSGGWDTADFGRQGGIWTVSLKSSSTYDLTAGASWSASVVNDVASI